MFIFYPINLSEVIITIIVVTKIGITTDVTNISLYDSLWVSPQSSKNTRLKLRMELKPACTDACVMPAPCFKRRQASCTRSMLIKSEKPMRIFWLNRWEMWYLLMCSSSAMDSSVRSILSKALLSVPNLIKIWQNSTDAAVLAVSVTAIPSLWWFVHIWDYLPLLQLAWLIMQMLWLRNIFLKLAISSWL